MISEHRLYFTRDRSRLVPEGDEGAATLAVAVGNEIPTEIVPHYERWLGGYSGEEAVEVRSSAADPGSYEEKPRAVANDDDTPEAAEQRAKLRASEDAQRRAAEAEADRKAEAAKKAAAEKKAAADKEDKE